MKQIIFLYLYYQIYGWTIQNSLHNHSWSPWQRWLILHESLTECDLQWLFFWGCNWGLVIPANTAAGFSINIIICCRLVGRWTSTAREKLKSYIRQQRGWMTMPFRQSTNTCTRPQTCMLTHHRKEGSRGTWCNTKEEASNLLAVCAFSPL